MTYSPLVSVVTPSFNHASYLEDYFQGLCRQTYPHIELIFLDDASTDRSWEVFSLYRPQLEKKFPRVVAERGERNEGFFKRLTQGFKEVRGEYVCILESDDYWYPEKVEENVRWLTAHPEAGLVHSDADYQYSVRMDKAHWKATERSIPTGQVFNELLLNNFIMTCTVCCRTELVRQYVDFEGYERKGYRMMDYPMGLDLARHTEFGYLDKVLACYRVLPQSASHSKDARTRLEFFKSTAHIQRDYAAQFGDSALANRVNEAYYRQLFRDAYEGGFWNEAEEAFGWLSIKFPGEFGAGSNKVRGLTLRHHWLWPVVRGLEETHLVHRVKQWAG